VRQTGLFPTFRAAARTLRQRRRAARQAAWIGRRTRSFLSGVAWSAAGLTCLLLLATLITNGIVGQALEQELARVRERGEPLTLREIAPPPVPDAENAALVYEQAFNRLPRLEKASLSGSPVTMRLAHEDETVLGQFVSDEAKKRAQASVPRVRQALGGTEEALTLVRQAAAMPRCRFPVNWEDGAGALFPHYPKLRSFSRLLGADAALAAMDGKPAEALADVRAIVGMTRQIDTESALIGRLIQYSCLAVAQESLRRLLETTSIDEAENHALDQTLAGVDLYEPFARSILGERCFGLWAFDVVRADPGKWQQLAGDHVTPVSLLLVGLPPVGSPLLKMDERFYVQFMARRVALAQRRGRITAAEWQDADDQLRYPWYAEVSRLVLPVFSHASDKRDLTVARLALARCGLALDLYRQRAGHYPESLAEVERAVGGALPGDPFSGTALTYRRQGSGYLIYSVGVNGRDDNGQTNRRNVPGSPGDRDDVAWRIGA
jgi:hypothetical protein